MKKKHILECIISLFLIFSSVSVFSQLKEIDTTKYEDRYGLRIGIDLFNPVYAIFDSNRKGLEFVADYRISKRFWVAGEFGYLDNYSDEDYYDFSTSGSYVKVGGDFNAYKNWPGLENMIVVGARIGFSVFDQTLEDYTINSDPYLSLQTNTIPVEYSGLTALWFEGVFGLKAELFHNVYMGFSLSGKFMINTTEPEDFKNLFVPGFNRVYVNDFGFGLNYTISYLIPFYRK